MKKLIFILLAVGLPLGVATLANPAGLTLAGWPAMTALALGTFGIQWLAFIPARLFQTERFYDLTGSITYIAVTLAAISAAAAPSGAQWLIAVMISSGPAVSAAFCSAASTRQVVINASIISRFRRRAFSSPGRCRAPGW